jgi:hypothetical protein
MRLTAPGSGSCAHESSFPIGMFCRPRSDFSWAKTGRSGGALQLLTSHTPGHTGPYAWVRRLRQLAAARGKQGQAVADPPAAVDGGSEPGCRILADAGATELRLGCWPASRLSLDDGTEPFAGSRIKSVQDRRGFTEAELATLSDEAARQGFGVLCEARAPARYAISVEATRSCPSRTTKGWSLLAPPLAVLRAPSGRTGRKDVGKRPVVTC